MLDANMKQRASLVVLGLTCGLVHLAVGLYYATRLSPQTPHGSLAANGNVYLASFPGWDTDSEQDAAGFNRTALSTLTRGLPYSHQGTLMLRTVVYSYFVAGCYAVGGIRLLSIAVGQALVSGLTCWILALAAGRPFPKNAAAPWIAAGLYLLNLRVAMYVGYVMPLIPTLLFMAIVLWAATQTTGRRLVVWLVASSVLGTYTSSTFFVIAMVGAFWLLFRRRSVTGFAAITVFVALKFVATWSNVEGRAAEPKRAAERGGIFWLSNNPYYESMRPWSLWEWRGSNPWSTWKMSDEERDRYATYLARAGQNELRATLAWILENPGHYLQVCLARLRTEFGPYTGQMSPRNRLISTAIWLLIFPAGLCSLWQSRRDATGQFVILIVICVFAFATLVTEEPYLRYRMPVDLLLTAFAGAAYGGWVARWRSQESAGHN
jgi:hypothetical protein